MEESGEALDAKELNRLFKAKSRKQKESNEEFRKEFDLFSSSGLMEAFSEVVLSINQQHEQSITQVKKEGELLKKGLLTLEEKEGVKVYSLTDKGHAFWQLMTS